MVAGSILLNVLPLVSCLVLASAFEINIHETSGDQPRKRVWKLCHPNKVERHGLYAIGAKQNCKKQHGDRPTQWKTTPNSDGSAFLLNADEKISPGPFQEEGAPGITYDPQLRTSWFSFGHPSYSWKDAEFINLGGSEELKHNDILQFAISEDGTYSGETLYCELSKYIPTPNAGRVTSQHAWHMMQQVGGVTEKNAHWHITRGGEASATTPAVEFRVFAPHTTGYQYEDPWDDPENAENSLMEQSSLGYLTQPIRAAMSKGTGKTANTVGSILTGTKDLGKAGLIGTKDLAKAGLFGALNAGVSTFGSIRNKLAGTTEQIDRPSYSLGDSSVSYKQPPSNPFGVRPNPFGARPNPFAASQKSNTVVTEKVEKIPIGQSGDEEEKIEIVEKVTDPDDII